MTNDKAFRAETLKMQALNCGVPGHVVFGLADYIVYKREQGGFLMAVLCNDLKGAVLRADSQNRDKLACFVDFLYNHAPAVCWGNRKAVELWMNSAEPQADGDGGE